MIEKEWLDKSVCDTVKTDNTKTWREIIREYENDFGIEQSDLDNMDKEELNKYIEWLDHLGEK